MSEEERQAAAERIRARCFVIEENLAVLDLLRDEDHELANLISVSPGRVVRKNRWGYRRLEILRHRSALVHVNGLLIARNDAEAALAAGSG